MSQVCRFFQMGTCKFGDRCKFEHPGSQTQNRFSAFGSGSNSSSSRLDGRSLPYSLSKDTIHRDLTSELPTWILSCYSPGKDVPEHLFGGYPREQSMEEIRLFYEKAAAQGKQQEALQEIQQLYTSAKQQIDNAAANVDNAIDFIIESAKKHPNRIDIVNQTNPPGGTRGEFLVGKRPLPSQTQTSSPFGAPSTTTTSGAFGSAAATGSAFGQSSTMGQRPSPFGAPAFGQPAQPTGGAFGKPSTPAFGQPSAPSAFAAPSATPFGQPSQPSAFGQAAQTGSAFGQPSQMGAAGPAFGQSGGMGQKPSPFGAPSGAGTGSSFGQPSQMGASGSAFGQAGGMGQKPSPFGAPSTTAASGSAGGFSAFAGGAASPFGQTAAGGAQSGFGQPSTSSPFGQSASTSGAFAQSTPATSSPFSQPAQAATSSPFGGGQAATTSPFGGGAGQPVASSPFGAPAPGQGQAAAANPFAKPANDSGSMDAQPTSSTAPFGQPQQAANPFGQPQPAFGGAAATTAAGAGSSTNPYGPASNKQHPPVEAYAQKALGNKLTTWKGASVTYRDGIPGYTSQRTGRWVRIWFPDGPPLYYAETEVPEAEFGPEAKGLWDAFEKTGRFEGLVPEVPPLRVHCRWDI